MNHKSHIHLTFLHLGAQVIRRCHKCPYDKMMNPGFNFRYFITTTVLIIIAGVAHRLINVVP